MVQKRWQSVLLGITTVIFIIFITLPWIGIAAWVSYIDRISGFVPNPSLSVTAYQTIHSFCHHLTSFDQEWNPEPLFNMPLTGNLSITLCVLIVVVFSSYTALKLKKGEIVFGAFIIAGLIISHASLDYHYTILLLPILILVNRLRSNSSTLLWCILIMSVLLIAVNLPYTSQRIASGWLALFAYPKLYGAIILWGLSVWFSYRSIQRARSLK